MRVLEPLGTGASLLGAPAFLPCGRAKPGVWEGVGGVPFFLESLLGPFLQLPGSGGDHCGSDLALSCSHPCQLAATPVSPTLALPQDLKAC